MKNQSESHGSSNSQNHENLKSDSRNINSSTQMKSGQEQIDAARSGTGGSSSSVDHPPAKQSGRSGTEHTNAGNTGFGSGQISPVTQHARGSGKSSEGPDRSSSGTNPNR